jgi:hypothetical protein
MLPFLSLHTLGAQRGDGLRPELLALFEREARSGTGLTAIIEPVETEPLSQVGGLVPKCLVEPCGVDESSTSD